MQLQDRRWNRYSGQRQLERPGVLVELPKRQPVEELEFARQLTMGQLEVAEPIAPVERQAWQQPE